MEAKPPFMGIFNLQLQFATDFKKFYLDKMKTIRYNFRMYNHFIDFLT